MNAVAQLDQKEEVYIEPPTGLLLKDKKDSELRLIKRVYDLKQAPNISLTRFPKVF